MASGLEVGESVYVPRTRLGLTEDHASVLHKTSVVEVSDRSVRVELPDGEFSGWVGSSLVHRMVGVQLYRIGDYDSETKLLDPLAKSLLQFCLLLFPDDMVFSHRVRSLAELGRLWTDKHAVNSHIIFVAHGTERGLHFGVDGWVDAETLSNKLAVTGVTPKTFLFLACRTGYKSFGGAFSGALPLCHAAIAPFHSFHGAVASQFCQTFLSQHFLQGVTTRVAFNHARSAIPGAVSFRMWSNGKLVAGQG